MNTILALVLSVTMISAAHADLNSYKKTKMETRTEVTSENCMTEYPKQCQAACAAGDAACAQKCTNDAPQACKDRDARHTKKTWEVIGKAATLGAGAAAVAIDKPMPTVIMDENGTKELSPYAIIWNKSSFNLELGGGLLESGTKIANLSTQYRGGMFGFGLNMDYLWDASGNLSDIDLGPTLSIASASFIFALQPSLLITTGSGELPVYGAGLRTYTQFVDGQFFAFLNPELGYINKKWAYDLKIGAGYRFTPSIFADFGYSYRDVIDFKDINISAASLQGAMLRIGYRMN